MPPAHGRPRRLVLQGALDLGHQLHALLRVQLLRLLGHHLLELLVAVAGVVAGRGAGEVLEEVGVGIVDADAREVGPGLVLLARGQGMPLRRLDLLQGRLDAHRLQLADHEGGEVEVLGNGPGGHLDAQRIRGAVAGLGQELPGLGLVVSGLAVAGQRGQILGQQPPHAEGLGLHGGPDLGAALVHGLHEGRADRWRS